MDNTTNSGIVYTANKNLNKADNIFNRKFIIKKLLLFTDSTLYKEQIALRLLYSNTNITKILVFIKEICYKTIFLV